MDHNCKLTIQWQQTQLEDYCSHYGQTGSVHWNHMLYADKSKVVYCYVPKTGCTQMKTMIVLLQDLYTMKQLNNTIVTNAKYLSRVRTMCIDKRHPCYQPKDNVSYLLNNYYKYVVVRDPLERLVSAYHNKLTTKDTFIDYRKLQKKILQYYRNDSTVLQSEFPSFSEFIGFLLHSKESFDKHFIPVIELCDPCQIKYNFYVNFKITNHDVDSIMHLLNIPREYYFNNIKHEEPYMAKSIHYNSSVIIDHFNQLSHDQRMRFFKEWTKELEFYDTIYPGELDIYRSKFSEFQHSGYNQWRI